MSNSSSNSINNDGWQQRISIQRTKLLRDNPFFGLIAIQLEVQEDNDVSTMSTDGTALYVNPDFVATLTDPELQFVLAHEVMHIALDHIPRLSNRDPSLWNEAADYVINHELIGNKSLKRPSGGLLDANFRNMATEDVYDTLMKRKSKPKNQSSSTTSGTGNNSNLDPGGTGGIQYPKGTSQQVDKQLADIKVKVSQAIAVAKAQNAGLLPASIQRLIQMAKPKQDWRPILREFVDDACQQNYSWAKQSRHSLAQDINPIIYLPGTVNDGTSHIVVAVDTSGSIDEDTLNTFISEVQAAADTSSIQKITVIYADAKVQKEDTFLLGDQIKPDPKGGGGTDFRDTFEHIRKHHQDAPLVIYFTDMETSSFGTPPDEPTKVLWAVWGTAHAFNHYAPRTPFGTAIHIS